MTDDIMTYINDYNAGLTYEKIANKYGKSKKWIMKLLKGKVTSRPSKQQPKILEIKTWDTIDERDKLIIELSKEHGQATIAKILNITRSAVRGALKKHRIPCRTISVLDSTVINELYDSGLSTSEIGKKFGVTSDAIRHHIGQLRNCHDANSIIPPSLQSEIIRLVKEEKWSSYKIAKEYGWAAQNVQNFLRRHKISVGSYTPEWKASVQRGLKNTASNLEIKVATLLNNANISYEKQFSIDDFRYDFKISGHNILIEVQGSYWHSKPQRRQRDIFKRKLAINNGYRLLIIWDFQISKPNFVINKVKNLINPIDYNFKNSQVTNVDWKYASALLDNFHYQGHGRSGACYGAYINNKLVGVAVFANCVRQEIALKQGLAYQQILELSRFVIDPEYQAKNFATWLLAKSIKLLKHDRPDIVRLVAFSDPTFGHDGTIYKASNWIYDGITTPSYWYYHHKKDKIYHKKTIWSEAKRLGISESELCNKRGLIKVIGQPKHRYIVNLT